MNYNFDVNIAKEYGVNEAILIENFRFWILKNKANGVNFYDGRYWTFNSLKAFKELFPFFTEKTIRTTLNHLKEKGVLITGNYNKSSYDRTTWYAFCDEEKWIGHIGQIHFPFWANGFSQNGEPIPDINTDNNIKEKEIYKEKESESLQKFDEFWEIYKPVSGRDGTCVSKGSKSRCQEKYIRIIQKTDHKKIITGLKNYLDYCKENRLCSCGAEVFLNQKRWENEYEVKGEDDVGYNPRL